MRKVKSWIFVVAVVGAAISAFGVEVNAAERFDRLVPEDVTNYMTVRNYDRMMAQLEASPYAGLMEEPEVKKFMEQIQKKMSEGLNELRAKTGMAPKSLENFVSGQLAFAMKQKVTAGGGQDVSALVLSELGPKTKQAEALLEGLVMKFKTDPSVSVKMEKIQGRDVRHFIIQTEKEKNEKNKKNEKLNPKLQKRLEKVAGKKLHVFVSIENGVMAVSAGEDGGMLQAHFAIRDGGDMAALADSALYKDLMGHVDHDSLYLGFQSYKSMWEGVKNSEQSIPLSIDLGDLLDELGVTGFEGQISAGKFTEDGLKSKSFIKISEPRKGILKAVNPGKSVEVTPPSFVGADSALYMGCYFSVPVLWEEMLRVVNKFAPKRHQQMRMWIDNPNLPLHIEKDIIQALGSRWFIYIPNEAVQQDGTSSVNAIIAIDLEKPETLQKSIDTLISMPQMQGKVVTEDVQGTTMYKTPPIPFFPALYGGANAAPPLHVCLAISGDQLLIGMSPGITRQAMQGNNRTPLVGAQDYRKVMPHVQSQATSLLYMDQRIVGKWVIGALKEPLKEEGIDLPSFQTLKKYLNISASTSRWLKDGVMMESWMEYPQGQ